MEIEILGEGSAFASALVTLNPGERFISESGAMFRHSPNIDVDVTTKSRGGSKGGFFSAIKRLFSGESFFFSTYTVTDDQAGEVGLAPTHLGQVVPVQLNGEIAWYTTGGSWIGGTDELTVDTEFQGFKGLLSGESLFFLRISGAGLMLVGAFGRIIEIDVTETEEITVDTGHVVAFEETLEYKIGKAGRSWLHTWLGGEGLVMHFSGTGKLLVQSHNLDAFGQELGPNLPPR